MASHEVIGRAACAVSMLMACSAPVESDGASTYTGGSAASGGTAPNGGAGAPALPAGLPATGTPQNASQNSGVGGSESLPNPMLTSSGNVPCDVAAIVSEHCTTCHASMPKFNAPMSLVSAQDFRAMSPINGTEPVHVVASRRIQAEGAARMPPPSTVDALDATELATLTAWLDSGAPPVDSGCAIGAGAAMGSGAEVAPRPTAAGTVTGPYEGWDEGDVECYPFLTYAAGDKQAPYRVGTAVDEYIGFGFRPPWQGTRYVRAFKSVIDNAQVLHHWILFEEPSATDGNVAAIVGAHPGGQMIHGWAPGGTDLFFTPDVGVRMDGSTSYLLEVHYNSNDPNAEDASGLEICVTATPPENEAAISWLGTDAINGTSATGTCRPRSQEPIHIIGGTPHMHLKGRAMKVTVNRAGGGSEIVHDEPFSFENQRGYPRDIRINSGDSITTTCTYSAPATFGTGTNDEMCYWFALAYPAGALADGGLLGSLLHGESACLGL